MNRRAVIVTVITAIVLLIGCQGGSDSPVLPDAVIAQEPSHSIAQQSRTCLWGYWNVSIDPDSMKVEIIPGRNVMYTMNVVGFLNENMPGIRFYINNTPIGPYYTDIDVDVSLFHPFPGKPQYDVYDVRGVFMGNGSGAMNYNPDLRYAEFGTDQTMLDDPIDEVGGPDGYTRWFNYSEFSSGEMELFSYLRGKLSPLLFAGNATLNPYKYFADGLGPEENLWDWLTANPDSRGVFSAGSTNTRNYYLRIRDDLWLEFGYAVLANWGGEDPGDHPSNTPEPVTCVVDDSESEFWYWNQYTNGGMLKLDISIFDWGEHPLPVEDYKIYVNAPFLDEPYEFTPDEMIPINSGEYWRTHHGEVESDTLRHAGEDEYWVIVEMADADYTNPFGDPNDANTDPVIVAFRGEIYAHPMSCPVPEVTDCEPNQANSGAILDDAAIECDYVLADGEYLEAWLHMPGQPEIHGTDVVFVDEGHVRADFDLTDAVPGLYDIYVVNGCGGIPGCGQELLDVL